MADIGRPVRIEERPAVPREVPAPATTPPVPRPVREPVPA